MFQELLEQRNLAIILELVPQEPRLQLTPVNLDNFETEEEDVLELSVCAANLGVLFPPRIK